MERQGTSPQIGVRLSPDFRAEVRAVADRHHEGNESSVLREGARLYVALRRKLGVNFEPTIHALIGEPAGDDGKAA